MASTRDDFEFWLCNVPDRLAWLEKQLPIGDENRLDYSHRSLNWLEEWLFERYRTVSDITEESEKVMLDALGIYAGECIRREHGGLWDINVTDKKNVFFGVPVVQKPGRWVECPVTLVTAAIDRRINGYLSACVAAVAS